MKCPCCGTESAQTIFVHDNIVHLPGMQFELAPAQAKILARLIAGPVPTISSRVSNVLSVHIHRIRRAFLDTGAPLSITTNFNDNQYELKWVRNVQDYNNAEHSQNVHPRSGLHDI
jgi:hypothetical protein